MSVKDKIVQDQYNSEFSYISDLLKTSDLNKRIIFFDLNSKKKNSFSFNQKKYRKS